MIKIKCVESSIECSEEVYLNDFDKFAHLHTTTTTKQMHSFFDKQKIPTNTSSALVKTSENNLNESFSKYSSPFIIDQEFEAQNDLNKYEEDDLINKQDYPPPPADFSDSNCKNSSLIVASSLNAATNAAINTAFENDTKSSKNSHLKKKSYKNESNSTISSSASSSSSFVAVSTASSLQETSHAGTSSSSESGSTKLANIRFNKHVKINIISNLCYSN
jgi:hypothetical protein